MSSRNAVLKHGLLSGALGSMASALILSICSAKENDSLAPPINAVSHWFWGKESFHRGNADFRHTVVGYITHHAAATFWATAYATLARNYPKTRTPEGIGAGAIATSAVACFVDYQLTPKRLMPGYEEELSRSALFGAYAAMAVGLAAGALLTRDNYQDENGCRR